MKAKLKMYWDKSKQFFHKLMDDPMGGWKVSAAANLLTTTLAVTCASIPILNVATLVLAILTSFFVFFFIFQMAAEVLNEYWPAEPKSRLATVGK